MDNRESKIRYFSPAGLDSLDNLFYNMFKKTKNLNSEVHINFLDDRIDHFHT